MPELPEVHTTATILNSLIKQKKICAVWTDYSSPHFEGKENIKNGKYFNFFKKHAIGKMIKKSMETSKVCINRS